MGDMMQGATGTQGTSSAQSAQLDAQLEIEAKKAALRGLRQQNAEGGPAMAPEAPTVNGTRIVVEKDGKTMVLENPTAEQLRSLGLSTAPPVMPDPIDRLDARQLMTLGVVAIVATVAVVYMVINAVRRARGDASASANAREFEVRMSRIENAIDSVAVEVERISENQRFATKVLSEGAAQNLNVPDNMTAVHKNRGER